MKFIYTLFALSFAGLSVAYPVSRDSILSKATIVDRNLAIEDLKSLATTKAAATTNTKVTAASVKTASSNFAKDANTVSASINTMGDTTDSKTLKSLATKAFAAESDEVFPLIHPLNPRSNVNRMRNDRSWLLPLVMPGLLPTPRLSRTPQLFSPG